MGGGGVGGGIGGGLGGGTGGGLGGNGNEGGNEGGASVTSITTSTPSRMTVDSSKRVNDEWKALLLSRTFQSLLNMPIVKLDA